MIRRIYFLAIQMLDVVFLAGAITVAQTATNSAASQAQLMELPGHLRWARENPSGRPPPEVRRAVRAEDKAWLMGEYRNQPRPSQRIASVWLLAYIGDDEVFRLFSEALRLATGTQPSEKVDVGKFTELLLGMGVVAQTNDLAFEFLTEAINRDWWATERRWKVSSLGRGENEAMAYLSILGLGLSTRAEVGVILDRIRKESANYVPPKGPRESWRPGLNVYTAKRYFEVSRKMGRQAFRDGLFGSEFKRYSLEWRRSEEGLRWLEWCVPRNELPELWRDVEGFFRRAEELGD